MNQNNYYISQSGPNQMNSNLMKFRKDNQDASEPDYNYKININHGEMGSQGTAQNPLLASVNTQGSLKNQNKNSGINITKKDAVQNLKSSMHFANNNAQTRSNINNTQESVGSINSNPGSTASRGSKYNIHQNQQQLNIQNMQNSNSPPSVRNKIQMNKILKNSMSKGQNLKKNPN
jgi:hypothetical protein